MPDNLTKQFKAELETRGITASDSDINNFISQQPNLFQSVGQPVSNVATQSSGLNRSLDMLDMSPDQKGSALDAVGAFLWRGLDATLLGIPGIALGEDEPYQWDTLGTGGKAGAVFGEALGFLAPLGVISKVGRAGVSAVKGTGAMTRKAVREAGSAAKVAGLSARLAEKTVKKTLRNPDIKNLGMPKYGLSGDDIAKVEEGMKAGIMGDLAKEFPEAGAKAIDDIGESVVRGLKSEGVHVNNIGHWVEKSLNTTLNVADKSKITRYAGRFAETSANFAVYNLLASGIQSMAGRQEFDPSADVGHAFMFSSLLPAVEMIGGGGKVRIIREANKLRKALGKFDTKIVSEYQNMSGKQLNGLMRVMTRDNYLKDTLMGKEVIQALRTTGAKDLGKAEAIEVMERLAGRIDPKKMWSDFAKYAGDDFVKSLGRMMVVGFYFNSATLLDYDLLKNMDKEILGAHLLTGMMFGKIKKPLFKDPHPTLNGFQERRLALEYFGIDASNIEGMARSFSLNEHQAAAYSGIRNVDIVQKIASIINTSENQEQSSKLNKSPARISGRDNLLKQVFGLYNIFELSGRVKDANPEPPVAYKNLTRGQLQKIKGELSKIDIGLITQVEGEKLTENNFSSFTNKLFKNVNTNQYELHMNMIIKGARDLNIPVDILEGEALDMDKRVGIGTVEGLDKFLDKEEYKYLIKWHQIRDMLEEAKLIDTIKDVEQTRVDNIDVKNIKLIEKSIKDMIEILKVENYGESSTVHIDPIDNGFLDALQNYKIQQNLSSAYSIVEGVNMTNRERNIRDWFKNNIGDKVPKSFYDLVSSVELLQGDIKKSEWDRINEGEINETIQKFKNVIKIWGINKSNGNFKERGVSKESNKIDYDKAIEIINLFEKGGYNISDSMVNNMNRYWTNEFFKTADINVQHQAILEHFIANEVVTFEQRANGKVAVIADRESAKNAFESIGIEAEALDQMMVKYDAVANKLGVLKGSFLEFRRKMGFEEGSEQNLFDAVTEAYLQTETFGKDILYHYDNVREVSTDHLQWIGRVKNLLESRKIVEGEKTEIAQFESEKEAKIYIAELDALIESGKKDFNLVSKESLDYLENLKRKIVMEEGVIRDLTEDYSSAAKLVEETILSEGKENYKLVSMIEAIVFDIQNYPGDRLQARRRMETMRARFAEDLEKIDIELTESDQLQDIAEMYSKSERLNVSEFVDILKMSLRVWRKGYDEKTYFETQKAFSEDWNDASTNNVDPTPRYSASYISQIYGKYNESLKGSNWIGIQEELRMSREKGILPEIIQLHTETIVDNVKQAINIKNEGRPQEAEAEFVSFMRHIFPSFLSNSIGTEKILSSELNFDSKNRPIISLKSIAIGKGSVTQFIDNMANSSIRVLRIENTGVFDGRKVDIRDELSNSGTLDKLIQDARIVPGESMLMQEVRYQSERGESYDETLVPFQRTVGVITSYNNRFLVALDNLNQKAPSGRGILNEKFKKWYDNKLSELTGDALAIKNLEGLFGDYVKKDAIHFTDEPVRQMVRAMYWDSITKSGFTDFIKAVDNQASLNKLGANYFKRFNLAESVGAKTQGSVQFLKEISKFTEYFTNEQKIAIDYSLDKNLNKGGYEIISLKDESGKAFSAERLGKQLLKEQLKEHDKGTPSYEAVEKQLKDLIKMLPSMADGRSSIDAHTHLGTNAMHAIYLHKGRLAGGMDGNGNTAGVKPTAWFNDASGTIMLKTNFTYDPKIAEIMDRLKIDILTTESASKFFNAELVDIKVSDLKGAKTFSDILENSGKFGKDRKELELGNNISKIGIENIFLGKTEDRHGVTNVTYSLSDWANAAGYRSHMGSYVEYDKKIDDGLGKLRNVISGTNRNAAADYLFDSLREEGALFEDSTTGFTAGLLKDGADPNSFLTRDVIQLTTIRNLVNQLRRPTTKGASYSVLIPFIEGTPSVYTTVDGVSKRIISGGKKVSHEDGNVEIKNWNNVKYIINFSTNKFGKRDLQAARDRNGEWIVDDPFGEINATNSNKLKTELKRLIKIEDIVRKGKEIKLRQLFNTLNSSNKRRRKEDTKFYINSHTLRMPNLGGDVVAHRVEDFYDPRMSNVTGVNIIDLATIHQADFDADMTFNHYDLPGEFSSALSKLSGISKDAFVYPSEGPVVDIFNTGGGLARAGSGGDNGDTMTIHQQKYMQSKKNFGAVKRVTAGLSAISRMGTSISGVKTLNIYSRDGEINPEFGGFLQRYKNVLQSIIDATQKPNFVSEAKNVEDVLKFVLFGKEFKGSEILDKDLLEKYGESKYKPFFEIDEKKYKGTQKEVLMDSIVESVRALGRTSRFLSDVWDESGRRPPQSNEIANMRSDLYRFVNNPNKQVFDTLLIKYNKEPNKQMSLISLFYDMSNDTYSSKKTLLADIYKKQLKTPQPDKEVIFFDKSIQERLDSNPGNYIVSRINQYRSALAGWSTVYNTKASPYNKKVTELLDDIEMIAALSGKNTHEKVHDLLNESDMVEGLGLRLKGSGIVENASGVAQNISDIQKYSILSHVLEKQRNSLSSFINNSGKASSNQIARANSRYRAVTAVMDYFKNREDTTIRDIVGVGLGEGAESRHKFFMSDLDFTKVSKPSQRRYENKSKDVHYLYKQYIGKDKVVRFKDAGWVKGNGVKYGLLKGKYVVLKNPVKWVILTDTETMDGYAMFRTTGKVTAENIHLTPDNNRLINRFMVSVDQLKSDIGQKASEAFEASKNSPHQMENWRWEAKEEGALIKNFMSEWLRETNFGETDNIADADLRLRIADISKYILQPKTVHGSVTVAKVGGEPIPMPLFKPNKRLSLAMFRWLEENGYEDIKKAIVKDYGDNYRQAADNVMREDMVDMHTSKLYHKGTMSVDRSPIVDLIYEQGLIYYPAMHHIARGDMKKYANKTKIQKDADGTMQIITQYGDIRNVQQMIKVYKDPKDFTDKEIECG